MSSIKGWKTSTVKDLCHLGRGRVIGGQEVEQNPGIYPVYSSQSKDHGKMGAIDTFDFDGEYVTWTTDGAYAGTVFYRNGKFNCTNVCGTLSAKESELDLKFLAYKLSTVAKNHVSYVGNPKLMNGVMADIEIDLPERKIEQTKIAEVLSTLDRAIEQTEALIAKQQRIKTGLMQDLLTKGIDAHGNIRSEATHAFKDSPLGRIPVEWDVNCLEEISEKISDGEHLSPKFQDVGVPLLSAKDVRPDLLDFSDARFISEEAAAKALARCDPRLDDVLLVSRGATIGRTHRIKVNVRFALMGSVIQIRPGAKCRSDYLEAFISYGPTQEELFRTSGSSAQQAIYLDHIKRLLLPVPSLREQDQMGNVLSSSESSAKSQREFLNKELLINNCNK